MAINSISTTRLMGLSSGMDTDTIVKNLMQIEQLKMNRELRAKTTLQWRQDALKSVSTDMKLFKNTFLTTLGVDGMLTSATYTSFTVSLSGSKKDAISIVANADAAVRNVTVNKITQLAGAASVKSGGKVSAAGQTELSEGNYVKLGELNFANDLFTGISTEQVPRQKQLTNAAGDLGYLDADNNLLFKAADGTFTDSNGDPVTGVNEADLRIAYEYDADNNPVYETDVDGNIIYDEVSGPSNYIEFSINGEKFTFTKDTTLAQMFSTINNSKANVSISYSRLTDGFTIASKETGADSTLTIENLHGNAFGVDSAFGIGEYGVTDEGGNPVGAAALKGQNSIIYVEGTRVERSTNSFTIDGIRYTLNFTTDETDDLNFNAENAITANFTQNVDAAVDKIKKFVEGYNTMVNKLYNLTIESKNGNYYALTDEEKSSMTESQIKEWETLAKSGLLRNDRDIQNVLSRLREAFYTTVEGVGLSPQDIGLRTAYNSRSGEIQLNEVDLRAALERDSDSVMRVFMNDSNSDEFKSNGLLYRLNDIIDTYTKETQYTTMSNLDKDLYKLNKKIEDMEERLAKIEEKYYLKYAAMETALSKLNSQSDWLSSMLGSLSK